MLRITVTDGDVDQTIVRLEGRLVEQWVALLGETVEANRKPGLPLVLDLSGLLFANGQGIELLRRLETDGVRCISWPPFLETLR